MLTSQRPQQEPARPFRWPFPPPGALLRYDGPVTGPTVIGRGNPYPQNRPSLLGMGQRARASMAAPGRAGSGRAGSLRPVFHPCQFAAARPLGGFSWFDS